MSGLEPSVGYSLSSEKATPSKFGGKRQNMALTVLHVPYSLDSGQPTTNEVGGGYVDQMILPAPYQLRGEAPSSKY